MHLSTSVSTHSILNMFETSGPIGIKFYLSIIMEGERLYSVQGRSGTELCFMATGSFHTDGETVVATLVNPF